MTVTISQEDTLLFQQHGFSKEQVGATVEHYRQEGLSDDDIQLKLNNRINEWKGLSPSIPQNYNGATISAYKPPSLMDRMKNAWQWTTEVPVAAFMEQKKNNEAAELRFKGMVLRKVGKDLTTEEKNRINQLDNPYSSGRYNQANNYGIPQRTFIYESEANFLPRMADSAKKLYADVMKQTGIYYSMLKEGGIAAGIGLAGGGAIGAVSGAVATKSPQGTIAGANAGARSGATLLARTAVAKKSFELESGFMRQELEQLNQEFINSGTEPLTDKDMDNLALAVGMINATLEYVGLNAVLKVIPNNEKILGAFGKEGVKELVKDQTFRSQLAALSLNLAKSGIEEGTTEAAQEYTNFLYSNIARKMRGVAPRPLAEKIDDIMYSGLIGSVAAIGMGGIGTTAQVTAVKMKQGLDEVTARREANSMNIDERNEFLSENIDTLAEVANEDADAKLNKLQSGDTYNRIKNEMERQGADSGLADSAAQLVQQAHNVIADKFGEEGRELLERSNLQILINQNNINQLNKEARFVDEGLKTRETHTFKPSELLTDARTFQYKENSDSEGVTDRMNGVEEFDPLFAGKIIVYQTKDGKKYIVDGHQRLGLAKRTGGDNIELEGFLFKEEDGYTPEQVRVLAAQKNIAEGSGTAIDTAKIIKEIGIENLPKTIPTNSAMVKDGIALSRLGDTAFQKIINGEITPAQAARIADIIRNDEDKQIAAIDGVKIANFSNLDQVAMFAREVLAADTVRSEQINLFGTQELLETTAIEKIQIVDKAIRSLRSDKKIFSGLLRNNSKIQGRGNNRLDRATNERINQQAGVAIELIEQLASRSGVISDKAVQLAGMVKKEEMTLDEAAKEFKAYVLSEEALNEVFGRVNREIAYNQAAISRQINNEENPYTSLNEISNNEESLIKPDEFYTKGLYQSARPDDIASWRAKYPDIAEALAEQDRLKAEGKLPPTIDINTEARKKLRLDIVKELYGKGAKKQEKQAYLIIGLPASGKSSMANPLEAETGSLIIDSDMAKERLPEFIESNGQRADQVHLESQIISEEVLKIAMQNGDNMILPIVGKSEKSIMSKYDRLKAAGYDVHLRLVDLPIEKTIERAVNRFRETGRLVPIDYITNEVGYRPVQNYVIMEKKGIFASYEAISTDVKYGEKPQPITTEEVIERLNDRGYGLQQEENIRGNRLEERSNRGGSDNRVVYNQGEANAPRGQFRIDQDGTAIIDILENGDPSTIVHELGHFYLYSLETLAKTNKRAAKELKEINNWLGKKDDLNYTEDELREFHEIFARGFEAYLLEGSAPTKTLLSAFQNFKDWLKGVYNSVKDLDVDFSESARLLFERVFTTDEEYQKEVMPKYQMNYYKTLEVEAQQNHPYYKFKKGLYDLGQGLELWYNKLFIPIETRLGKISPELRDKLRNHTAQLALITGKDLKVAADFLKKTEAMKAASKEDYLCFDLALKNRDEVMVRIIADKYNFRKEFDDVRDILDDIYDSALEVGIDVGYLDNYFPRLVKRDLTEKYLEYIEALANKEQRDVVNQVIKLEDAKFSKVLRDLAEADNSQFWSTEDRAKFINNHIRGFGKNNILLSRNASLKFERNIDELDASFNQFYETFEPALINYISNSRKTIEARKFFGSEYKDVGKLRARIKRKKKTLDEVEQRTPAQAKGKEIERIKYELSPIKIKLEQLERRGDDLPAEQVEYREALKKKAARLESQIEFVSKIKANSVKNMVKKRLREEIKAAGEEITNIIGNSENVEDSIGALVTKLAQDGDIYAKDEKLIRELLLARFNASRVCEPVKMVRDLTYAATLNDITNAVTQFGDLAFSVYKYGFEDTFKGMKKPFEISKEDLGINDMAHEFSDPSAISKWIRKQFSLIGLNAIDGLGKNTIIQSALLNAQKKAKANNSELNEKLKRIFGKDAEKVKKDLADGNITDDVIIYAYNELADIQPISEDQTAELYQTGGGFMKLFYTLKTYGIKALDVARSDITNNIQQGIMNKNKGQVKKGLQNLIRLQMLLWLFGVPVDALKDLLSNRDINIFESMIDTLIPTFIVNRFLFKDVGSRGLGYTIVNFFTPSTVPVATRALSGKASAVANIPIIGKPIYNWFLKDK